MQGPFCHCSKIRSYRTRCPAFVSTMLSLPRHRLGAEVKNACPWYVFDPPAWPFSPGSTIAAGLVRRYGVKRGPHQGKRIAPRSPPYRVVPFLPGAVFTRIAGARGKRPGRSRSRSRRRRLIRRGRRKFGRVDRTAWFSGRRPSGSSRRARTTATAERQRERAVSPCRTRRR